MTERWADIEREPKGLLRIMSYVRKNGASHGPRKRYTIAGLNIFYDKVWFTGSSDLDKHRLSGSDWDVTIGLWKSAIYTDVKAMRNVVHFDNQQRWLEKVAIQNSENLRRDLTLLRMFGSEELFSGRA